MVQSDQQRNVVLSRLWLICHLCSQPSVYLVDHQHALGPPPGPNPGKLMASIPGVAIGFPGCNLATCILYCSMSPSEAPTFCNLSRMAAASRWISPALFCPIILSRVEKVKPETPVVKRPWPSSLWLSMSSDFSDRNQRFERTTSPHASRGAPRHDECRWCTSRHSASSLDFVWMICLLGEGRRTIGHTNEYMFLQIFANAWKFDMHRYFGLLEHFSPSDSR